MVDKDSVSLRTMARDAPVRSALFTVFPVVIAVVQLLNSYVNDLPLAASVPFAVVMVAYSVMITRHSLSEIRLRKLECNEWLMDRPRSGSRY